jgi:NTE family protein
MMWFSGTRKADNAEQAIMPEASANHDFVPESGTNTANETTTQPVMQMAEENFETQSGSSSPLVPNNTSIPAEPVKSTAPARPERRPVGRNRCGGVALALGGGVARGWAHIGVLKAVEEFGLPVSMIAGTSIGALVGGSYLAGNMDELENFARSLTKSNIIRYLDFTLRGSGLITGSRLARRMEEHMADVNIEDLSKPFVAVATDIQSGHEIWLGDGPLVPAIRASYALPGVFTPVLHGGRQLVDGAIVNPVPVSVCRAFEPDLVIAVNLNAESIGRGTVVRASHYENIEVAITEDPNSQAGGWFSFMHTREKSVHRENRLGVTSVMVEAFNIIQDRIARARLAGDPPDFTVRPKLKNIGLIEFHKAEEAINLGYEEMMARLRDLEDQGAFDSVSAVRASR